MSKRITRRAPPHARAISTALALAACSAQPISGVSPGDAAPETATPDTDVDAGDGATGDAHGNVGSSPDAGLDGAPGSTSGADSGGASADAGTADAQSDSSVSADASVTDSGSGGGADAPGEASCSIGQCPPTTLVTTTQPIGLAVNETTVYWETGGLKGYGAGSLMSASVAGTGVFTLFAGSSDAGAPGIDNAQLNDLVVDSTSAYFTVNASTSNYVQAVRLDGTGASTLDVYATVDDREQAIALDATALYVARAYIDPQGGGCPDLGIDVVPLNQGPTTTLYGACLVVRLAVDSSQNLYWTDRGHPPYIVNQAVMMQSVSATSPTKLASATSPYGIAVYGGYVYWSDSGNIMVLPMGATTASVLSSSADPKDLVVDSSGVYWIDSGSAVMMAPLGGGAATTLAQGQNNVVALATNSTSVFWVNEGTEASNYVDGAVMRVAK
jgi:hypothetical protein